MGCYFFFWVCVYLLNNKILTWNDSGTESWVPFTKQLSFIVYPCWQQLILKHMKLFLSNFFCEVRKIINNDSNPHQSGFHSENVCVKVNNKLQISHPHLFYLTSQQLLAKESMSCDQNISFFRFCDTARN